MPDFPKTYDAGIILPRQDRPEDCWADCVAGVLRFLGLTVTQDDVRQRVLGDRDEPAPADAIPQVLALYRVACAGPDEPLSLGALMAELTADPVRPVMVGYLWDEGGGHVALVTGFRDWTKRFLIQDPFFGPGELSWGEILAGYGVGRWVVSYGRFAKKDSS